MKNEIAAKEKLIEKEIVYNVFLKKSEKCDGFPMSLNNN